MAGRCGGRRSDDAIIEEGVDLQLNGLLFRAATPFESFLTGETMACGGATVLELYDIVVWVPMKGFVWFEDWRCLGRLWFLWRGERCVRRRYGRVSCHWHEKILFSGTRWS
jgi:hypothetical protein